MLNEGVYRSPKWMRNFLDFEINTGKDIKGEPSKRAILKEWDKRWRECREDYFKKFYSLIIKGDEWAKWITSSELEEIRKELRGDMSVWKKYDEWLPMYKKSEERLKKEAEERARKREEEERERERYERYRKAEREKYDKEKSEKERQQRISKELDDLFSAMVKDFSKYPYDDKYSTPRRNGQICFEYRFENGDKFDMSDNKITYKNSIYTVGLIYKNKFVKLCNEINSKGRTRPGSSGGYSSGSSGRSSSGSRYSSNKKSDDPNRDRYDKLMDNIKLREEQLRKMSKTDSNRTSLENELDNYKRAAERMKNRYKFENIKSFVGFFRY